jgi:hypothetical protein
VLYLCWQIKKKNDVIQDPVVSQTQRTNCPRIKNQAQFPAVFYFENWLERQSLLK